MNVSLEPFGNYFVLLPSLLHRLANSPRAWCSLPLAVACLLCAGCADGPLNGGGSWNPWVRKEWEKDEKRGPTFHTKVRDLKQMQREVATMSVDRQGALADELMQRYRNETSSFLRAEIVTLLGRMRVETVDDTIIAATQDTDSDVRIAAAKALGSRGNEQALDTLAKMLSNETNLDVRLAATTELGKFKNSPEATRALALALGDNNAALQFRAIHSLENVTGRYYGMSVPAWREYLAGGNPTPVPPPSIATQLKDWAWW